MIYFHFQGFDIVYVCLILDIKVNSRDTTGLTFVKISNNTASLEIISFWILLNFKSS
jgi:hypothetical protein